MLCGNVGGKLFAPFVLSTSAFLNILSFIPYKIALICAEVSFFNIPIEAWNSWDGAFTIPHPPRRCSFNDRDRSGYRSMRYINTPRGQSNRGFCMFLRRFRAPSLITGPISPAPRVACINSLISEVPRRGVAAIISHRAKKVTTLSLDTLREECGVFGIVSRSRTHGLSRHLCAVGQDGALSSDRQSCISGIGYVGCV